MERKDVKDIVVAVLAANKANSTPIYKDWRFIVGLPAAALAFITLWVALGFPTIATSSDISRIERNSADVSIQTYTNAINNLIATTPNDDAAPAVRRAWQQQFDQMNKRLDEANKKKIELSR